MRSVSATILSLLSLASTSFAATAGIKSQCNDQVYLTVTNSTQQSTQYTIAPNGTYSQPLAGSGNSYGITKDPDYYSSSTPKFVFGWTDSTSDQLTYWSVSSVDGNPLVGGAGEGGFNVVFSDPTCSGATTYDGQVHTCPDYNSVVVYLC
ncbi:hypothetical protein MBLNU459_g3040t2 [Dothideomycetes sp. NU459]